MDKLTIRKLSELTGFPYGTLDSAVRKGRMVAQKDPYFDRCIINLTDFFNAVRSRKFKPRFKIRDKITSNAVAQAAKGDEFKNDWLMVAKVMSSVGLPKKAEKKPHPPLSAELVTMKELSAMIGIKRESVARLNYVTPSDTLKVTSIDRLGTMTPKGTPLYSLESFLRLAKEGVINITERKTRRANQLQKIKKSLINTAYNIDPANKADWLELADKISD